MEIFPRLYSFVILFIFYYFLWLKYHFFLFWIYLLFHPVLITNFKQCGCCFLYYEIKDLFIIILPSKVEFNKIQKLSFLWTNPKIIQQTFFSYYEYSKTTLFSCDILERGRASGIPSTLSIPTHFTDRYISYKTRFLMRGG